MPKTTTPTVDEYWAALQPHLPGYARDEQRAAVMLYRELTRGEPLDGARLARALNISTAEAQAILQRDSIKCLIYADGLGRILGFGGLAVTPMHHRLEVDGRGLSTWCAWDSLFIPEILGRPARVASPDPETGELVLLFVRPKRIESPSSPRRSPRRRAPDAAGPFAKG